MQNLLICFIFLISCNPILQSKTEQKIIWVNAYYSNCEKTGLEKCFQIQQGEKLKPKNWKNYNAEIEGFQYQPGFIYKLKVKEIQLPSQNLSVQNSNKKLTLTKILEKVPSPLLGLHDIFVIKSQKKNKILKEIQNTSIEINILKNQIFINEGCQEFQAELLFKKDNKIYFKNFIFLKSECNKPKNSVIELLKEVSNFKRASLNLYFYNENGQKLLEMKKVD